MSAPHWQARFLSKFDRDPAGCWEWTAGRSSEGYGKFYVHQPRPQTLLAHRVAYELFVGAIPDGLQLDHLCRNRACVNPAHLEPVTPQVNSLRGQTLPALNAAKERCPNGHDYEPRRYRRGRVCPTCKRAADTASQRRRRAERRAA